jgi:hypothetical protein
MPRQEQTMRRVFAGNAGGALQLCGKRMQRAVGVMREAKIAYPGARLAAQALPQGGNDARLDDARLT